MRMLSVDISRRLTFFVVLALFTGTMSARSDVPCDSELRSVRGLLALLEGSLKRGELDPNEVQQSFQIEPWKNPYSNAPKSIQNLSALRGFERTRAKFNRDQRADFLEKLNGLLQHTRRQTKAVAVAKEDTAEFILLKTTHIIERQSNVGTMISGLYQGRPVFVHQMELNGQSGLFMIDYNGGNPTTRLLADSLGTVTSANDRGSIFHWNGRDYILNTITMDIYDLETGNLATFSNLRPKSPFPEYSRANIQSAKVIAFEDTLRLVSWWYEVGGSSVPTDRAWLYSVDLVGPQKEQTLIAGGPTHSAPKLDRISSQQPIVHFYSRKDPKVVKFFDMSQDLPSAITIPLNDDRINENCAPLVFTRDGKKLALILTTTANGYPSAVGLYDLENRKYVKNLNVETPDFTADGLTEMSLHEIDGHPYVAMHFASGFALYDLMAERIAWSQRQLYKPGVSVFKWRGNPYFLMSTSAHQIQVRDFTTGLLSAEMKAPEGSVFYTHAFEVNGKPTGFGASSVGHRPFFFKILTRD